MRLATWNINSVRLRFSIVARLLRQEAPDVLCLQEIKVVNDLFPAKKFARLGYVHQAVHGQKGYHGVAILSKLPFAESGALQFCGKDDCRHMAVTLENGVELHNFYVPAGGDVPDPEVNDKFAHKLKFLREMGEMFAGRGDGKSKKVVLVGDLNVAPLENDVWSHKQMLRIVSHTPVEVDLLNRAREAFDWNDVTRDFVPADQKIYSWWSYRAADWKASDRGRRLDHVWSSPGLKGRATQHKILKDVRGWKRPSDHVPIVVDFDV